MQKVKNILRKLSKLGIYIFMLPLYWLSYIIPKDKNLWIFGAAKGKYFLDNSKYLFLYLQRFEQPKCIWISRNKEVIKFLRSRNFDAYYYYSIKGIWYMLRASKIFLSHRVDDVNRYITGGAEVIQLWHGIPLKKIGYKGDWNDENIVGKLKKILFKMIPYSYYLMCDRLLIPSHSEDIIENFKEAFKFSFRRNNKEKNFIFLPYPRWFIFTNIIEMDEYIFPEINLLKSYRNRFDYIITWMPTHRAQLNKSLDKIINEIEFDFEYINSFLKGKNALFVIKPHFLDIETLKRQVLQFDNIIVYDSLDPYPLLNYTDILITDYSSIYFDFLIKDKPIIFVPYDIDDYEKKVGFYYNYNDITPGHKVKHFQKLIKVIEEIINGKDDYKEIREEIRKKLIIYNDYNNYWEYFK